MHAARLRPAARICRSLRMFARRSQHVSPRLGGAPVFRTSDDHSAGRHLFGCFHVDSDRKQRGEHSLSISVAFPPAAEYLLSFSLHICTARGARPGGGKGSTAVHHCRINVFTQLR